MAQKRTLQGFDQLLAQAAHDGDLKKLDRLIGYGVSPMADDSRALENAARAGHAEAVRRLIPISDPKAQSSKALMRACQFGHTEIVRMLIPVSDATVNNSHALRLAAEHGHLAILELLLPLSKNQASILHEFGKHFTPQAHAMIRSHLDGRALDTGTDKDFARISPPKANPPAL